MERQSITIYNLNFEIVAIIDEYISLIWKQVFNGDVGGFDLEVPATQENIKAFKKNYYITRNDKNGWQPVSKQQGGKSILQCQDVMIVEAIELSYDNNGNRSLIIGGSDVTCILKRRIFTESFYVSDQEYFGFFGKLGEKLALRGLPIHPFFNWRKIQGNADLETYGSFIDCQEMGYLDTYSDLAEPTTETIVRPDYALDYPYTHVDNTNQTSSSPDTIYTESIIARIIGVYYWLNDQYYGFHPEQGQVVHYQNGYYILLQKVPNTPEITRQVLFFTESIAYWYLLPVPTPTTQKTVYEFESGNPAIYSGIAISGSGEAVYPQSGISNAQWGDIYLHIPSFTDPRRSIYICSLGGDPNTAKWTYFLTQKYYIDPSSQGIFPSLILVPSDAVWGSGGLDIDNSNHNLKLLNNIIFPDGWDTALTPFYVLPDTDQVSLLVASINGSFLTFSNPLPVVSGIVTEFQLTKTVKHESYFDVLSEVMKEYQTGLKLYPDSDLSRQTKYRYAIYDGEDRSGSNGDDLVVFSIDFENLIKTTSTTDNSDSANVAYISSDYPRNPADKNITEIELTTYTPQIAPETIQRREVFVDRNISYRDGAGGPILQIQEFKKLLIAAANQALVSDYQDKEKFDCEIRTNGSLYQLNRDFFLGDKVLVRDIFGNEKTMRITETTETWDNNGYSTDIKLEYIPTEDAFIPEGVLLTEDDDYITTEDDDYIEY